MSGFIKDTFSKAAEGALTLAAPEIVLPLKAAAALGRTLG